MVAYVSQILVLEGGSTDQGLDSSAILEALNATRSELPSSSKRPNIHKAKGAESRAAESSDDLSRLLDMTARRLRAR